MGIEDPPMRQERNAETLVVVKRLETRAQGIPLRKRGQIAVGEFRLGGHPAASRGGVEILETAIGIRDQRTVVVIDRGCARRRRVVKTRRTLRGRCVPERGADDEAREHADGRGNGVTMTQDRILPDQAEKEPYSSAPAPSRGAPRHRRAIAITMSADTREYRNAQTNRC